MIKRLAGCCLFVSILAATGCTSGYYLQIRAISDAQKNFRAYQRGVEKMDREVCEINDGVKVKYTPYRGNYIDQGVVLVVDIVSGAVLTPILWPVTQIMVRQCRTQRDQIIEQLESD